MKLQLAALRKSCGKDIELGTFQIAWLNTVCSVFGIVFVDAPHVLNPVDIADAFGSTGHVEASGTPEDPALRPRGWWKKGKEYHGLEESIAFLKEMLIKERYVVSECPLSHDVSLI